MLSNFNMFFEKVLLKTWIWDKIILTPRGLGQQGLMLGEFTYWSKGFRQLSQL